MNLPIAYILLKFNFAVELVFVVAIVISQLCLLARLHLLRGMIGLHAREFLRKVYFNVLIVTILAGEYHLSSSFLSSGAISFLFQCLVSVFLSLLVIFLLVAIEWNVLLQYKNKYGL